MSLICENQVITQKMGKLSYDNHKIAHFLLYNVVKTTYLYLQNSPLEGSKCHYCPGLGVTNPWCQQCHNLSSCLTVIRENALCCQEKPHILVWVSIGDILVV